MDIVTNEKFEKITEVLLQIEKIRGRKQLSIFTAFLEKPDSPTSISTDLYDIIVKTVNESGYENEPLDIILHSGGGSIFETKRIVSFLRSKFSNIDFLIAHSAFSAATIMSLSGDNIIMSGCAALGPTDVHYRLKSGEWFPEKIYLKSLKTIKKSMSFFSTTKSSFVENYTIGELNGLIRQIAREKHYTPRLTEYFILRFMFKRLNLTEIDVLSKYTRKNYIDSIMRNFRTHSLAMKATSFFCTPKQHLSHNQRLMFDDIKHLGLNIEKADPELETLLWDLYEKHTILFRNTKINLIVFSTSAYNYIYTNTLEKSNE